MNQDLQSTLWKQYGCLLEVAERTVTALGEERAWLFITLANDWLDIQGGVLDSYPHDELQNSLVFADFAGLFKDIRWLQLLFLGGNYAMLYRGLRFDWELAVRALHADT